LWLFHRQPIAPTADVEAMRQIASDMGLDISSLLVVEQNGCLYEGAFDPSV
jgi:lipocalin